MNKKDPARDKPCGFLIDPGKLPEYEAPEPFRRTMKVLVDETVFSGASMCIALVTYPAGARCPFHSHPEATEVYFVLEGELVATVRGKPTTVSRGQMFCIPPFVEHRAENQTGRICRFMAVHAPPVEDVAEVKQHWKILV